MIYRNLTLTVKDDGIRMSNKIMLYREDGNIELSIRIQGLPYRFEFDKFECSCVIKRPNGTFIYKDYLPVDDNGLIHVVFDKMMFDELSEVGTFYIQLSFHSEASHSDRITLPPFSFEVQKQLAD